MEFNMAAATPVPHLHTVYRCLHHCPVYHNLYCHTYRYPYYSYDPYRPYENAAGPDRSRRIPILSRVAQHRFGPSSHGRWTGAVGGDWPMANVGGTSAEWSHGAVARHLAAQFNGNDGAGLH